jgi:hypothetical protein
MRWPWISRRQAADSVPDDDVEDAAAARRRAEAALRAAKDRTTEIRAVTDRALHHRRVNHFAQLISETFRGIQ